jgi:threonine dehydratase
VLLGIETASAANFPTLFARMDAAGFTYRDITDDETLGGFVI